MENVFITNSSLQTQKLGERVAKNLRGGEVLALRGDLGSGKTTFLQGLAKGLGLKRNIISPTFIIVRKYGFEEKSFYHIDLYRISKDADIRNLGIEEILGDSNSIIAIEWAEKINRFLPKNKIDLKFEYLDEGKRKITINNLF